MIKRVLLPILLILLFLINPVLAANEPENLTAVPFATSVVLDWDDVAGASHYSIYRYLPSMLWTNETLELDGIIDSEYLEDGSNKAVAFSPNPPFTNAYDTFYILRNGTYVMMAADTFDNDNQEDDSAGVYVDFDRDGLTNNVDLNYEIQEDGDVVKRKWVSGTWNTQSTGAIGAVTGAGTTNPVYELFVPISELPSFGNETWHYITIERCDNSGIGEICTYQPRDTTNDDTTGWAPLNITTVENQTFFNVVNVTESTGTITSLDPFDIYYFGVSATISSVEYPQSTISFITLNTPTYNVSGFVYDAETYNPIANASILIQDGLGVARTSTDVLGFYTFEGILNDTYTMQVTANNYDFKSINVNVLGEDKENINIYLDKSIQDEIPLWLFVVFVIINIGTIVVAFHNDLEVGIFNIFCSFMATVLSYLNSKILINGYLIESFEFGSTIQNAAYSAVFHYVAIIMAIMTALLIVMYIKEVLEEEDL